MNAQSLLFTCFVCEYFNVETSCLSICSSMKEMNIFKMNDELDLAVNI